MINAPGGSYTAGTTGITSTADSMLLPSIESNMHPLYLHSNDQTSLVLISKKLVGTENFGPWKRSLQIALSARNKLAIVTGHFEEPDCYDLFQ